MENIERTVRKKVEELQLEVRNQLKELEEKNQIIKFFLQKEMYE